MKQLLSFKAFVPCLIIALEAGYCVAQPAPADNPPPPIPAQEQPEVLTSGPVNEAFAKPVEVQPEQQSFSAPQQPPPAINEVPPDERPEGDHFVWVPGYWAWDVGQKGYIWVSGCWRAAPANMSWVPGYWSQSGNGWTWIPGFWTTTGQDEIEYLPTPPPLENVEAPAQPPSPDVIWVPPCWYWRDGQYVRREGYWLTPQPGWCWVASDYVATPRGCVFVAGHWDYPLEDRGVLFAPVRFPQAEVVAGFTFSPTTVIQADVLTTSLFTCPTYDHYFFGDYYDNTYTQAGIYPWFDREHIHNWYDPIYEDERWEHRRDNVHWAEEERHEYEIRRDDRDLRPPRTYHEMETRATRLPEQQRRYVQVAQPIQNIVNNTTIVNNRTTAVNKRTTNLKFEKINNDTRQTIARQAKDVENYRGQRRTWEAARGEAAHGEAARGEAARRGEPARGVITEPGRAPAKETRPEDRGTAAAPAPAERGREPARGQEAPAPSVQRGREATPAPAPSTERREPSAPAPQRSEPAAGAPSAERRAEPTPAHAPADRATRSENAVQASNRQTPAPEPARRSERVKVPAPPIAAHSRETGPAARTPPPQPADEHRQEAPARNAEPPTRGQSPARGEGDRRGG